ncbi:ORF 72 [Sulfolobus spindle-shaped virus 2]|uniref:Fuselloviral protein SSV2p14 n=2 Tax=root TaxID=1 RepID=A0A157T054_SACSO|nr:ORF 72 [Sulfolobus spindle-shaped virus 2]AAQ73261.1 ORF 72 [Sulfolobus spindle-shaped virus 2]SAI84251.1 Fuselloviral protein SSV2p14 [Saccharolobus solfataricus]
MRKLTNDFFPTTVDDRVKELLTTILALGGSAVTIPYAEFLKILGILDSKEAREAYETFKVLLERIDRLRKRD